MTARMAYVYLLPGPAPGVERKARDQAAALEKLGVDDLGIYVVSSRTGPSQGPLHYVQVSRGLFRGRVAYALRRFRLIERAVECARHELVLLRYPNADPAAPAFADRYRVVSEHHTKETEERKALLRGQLPFGQRMYKSLSLAWETRHGPRYLSRCRGIVGVTDEVRDYELARAQRGTPAMTWSNGIDVEGVRPTRFTPFDGRNLNLVLVGGRANPWHGTDRLLGSLAAYTGPVQITCHLVGDLEVPTHGPSVSSAFRLERHGRLVGDSLDALMREMNLAVSSLGLFRNGMRQGAPLKTREYMARGIPFVMAHDDPDLPPSEVGSGFFLSLPNDESMLPVDRIIEFAERATRLETEERLSERMRAYARRNMDWTRKMQRLLPFLRGLAA